MMKTLLVATLCFVGCFSAPLTTAPPTTVPATTANEEGESPTASGLDQANINSDVMMDPTAKMRWQKQEGDITYLTDKFLFPENPDDPFFTLPANGQRSKRAAVRDRYKLWPHGVIPYVLSTNYSNWEIYIVKLAMAHWENHTCIRFVPQTNERDFIQVFPGRGCYSYIGRIGRHQGVSVGRACFSFENTVHELGHAIGFYHEQSRPDRDEHVRIIEENIRDGAEGNFEIRDETKVDSLGVGYDYNSIMHYDANLFSINGGPTIEALDPDIPLGRATTLSELDIEQTNRLYHCPAIPPPRQTVVEEVVHDRPSFPSELPYPDCGAFITDLSGTIESPGYPEYPHNTDCVWMFRMPRSGYNIVFIFQPFHVERSPDCETDYVQIYESLDTSGHTFGKKCGNFINYYPTTSLTSYAYLHFHTNGSNETPNLKGFRLNYYAYDIDECHPSWSICSHGCNNFDGGFECTCPEGFFMSADGVNCFDVNECGLDKGGCDHKCVNRAGTYHCACDEGYTLLGDNRTCVAEGNPTPDPCAINNGGCSHICTVSGTTALCSCRSGYELAADRRYCDLIDPCSINNGGCAHTCAASDGSAVCSCRAGYELAADGSSCNFIDPCSTNNGGCEHICTSSSGLAVCSCRPGYQLDSTDSSSCIDIDECASNGGKGDCDHICTNTPGSRVCSCPEGYELQEDGIACEDVDECNENNGGCQQLHCINSEGSFTCGCEEGFKMIDGSSCASVLQGPSGQLSSDNWPATYPVNVDSQWVIECGANQLVQLTFSDGFGIAGRLPDCEKDWLKVYDGDSTSADLLGKFCHLPVPEVPLSSTNILLVHFYAGPDHSSSRKGFEFSYTCENVATPTTVPRVPEEVTVETPSELPVQPSQCGQTDFTESTGTIESPNWPETYPTDVTCEYFIELPNESHTINITFDDGFRIAGRYPECDKDWVKIYDGHTDDSELFGTYCHFTTPPVIITSGSKAKIVLYAGSYHSPSRNGFSATYTSKSN